MAGLLGGRSEEYDLFQNLKSKEWRLDNLYKIIDQDGRVVTFKRNTAQKKLFDNLKYWNVILKARQQGFTTFACIDYLDDTLFLGMNSGMISHNLAHAQSTFDEKIKFAWDNLPQTIKNMFYVQGDNANRLKVKNLATNKVSSIYVSTGFRGGTLQRLHISEMSSIDRKGGGAAKEVITGAIPAVHPGNIIIMESTAKGNDGSFYDICKTGEENAINGKCGVKDWYLHFFSWFDDDRNVIHDDNMIIPIEERDYFTKLQEETGVILTKSQKNWYYKTHLTQGDDMKQEYPSTVKEAFQAAVDGRFFTTQTDRVTKEGRLCDVPYDSRYPVDTWWDLGTATSRKDSMSVLFTQKIGAWIHVIDFFGCNGEGLPYVVRELNKKPYTYGRHFAPHDIEVKEIGTGKTRLEIAADLGIRFNVLPRLPFIDGIEASRLIMDRCLFDEERCGGKKGLFEALKNFKKDWDENLCRFRDTPVKDWTSDPVDSFRMMSIGIREDFFDMDKEKDYYFIRKQEEEYARNSNPLDLFGI